VVSIPLLRAHVARRGKYDTRTFALWWNIFLAAFSMVGLSACLPVMLHELWHNGVDFTVCASASWYGHGWHGLWVAFFIYSKFFELVDTVLLLLAGRPVILLHWWHHSTVLLYCWHAYATTPGTGMWYATMNYGVHSIMYAYFAATQHSKRAREAVKPCAIYITLLQLLQMVVGIALTEDTRGLVGQKLLKLIITTPSNCGWIFQTADVARPMLSSTKTKGLRNGSESIRNRECLDESSSV